MEPRELTFPFAIVTEEEFPAGLLCVPCGRTIGHGEPFDRKLLDCTADGEMETIQLCCVYCASKDDPQDPDQKDMELLASAVLFTAGAGLLMAAGALAGFAAGWWKGRGHRV